MVNVIEVYVKIFSDQIRRNVWRGVCLEESFRENVNALVMFVFEF